MDRRPITNCITTITNIGFVASREKPALDNPKEIYENYIKKLVLRSQLHPPIHQASGACAVLPDGDHAYIFKLHDMVIFISVVHHI